MTAKMTLLGSLLDGDTAWRLLKHPDYRYSLVGAPAGTATLKYYNQGCKLMSVHEFNKEVRTGKILLARPYTPVGEYVVLMASSGKVDFVREHQVKRGRFTGFAFSCGTLRTTVNNSISSDIAKDMQVHSLSFSYDTGGISIVARIPRDTVLTETVEHTVLSNVRPYIKNNIEELGTFLSHSIAKELNTIEVGQDFIRESLREIIKTFGAHTQEGNWILNWLRDYTQEGTWANPQQKVYAENAWLMCNHHYEDRGAYMERWRTDCLKAQWLESQPLEVRLAKITKEELAKPCFYQDIGSYGFMVDWRLLLTDDEAKEQLESLTDSPWAGIAMDRWREAQLL